VPFTISIFTEDLSCMFSVIDEIADSVNVNCESETSLRMNMDETCLLIYRINSLNPNMVLVDVYNGLPKFLGRLLYAYLHPLLGADELSG
jgi:hypothetical protein